MMRPLLLGLAIVLAGCGVSNAPAQPIEFNHALHLSKELAAKLDQRPLVCTDCHAGAERGQNAGLPALSVCLRCHMKPMTNAKGEVSAEEPKVRELAAKPAAFRWVQVTRNPGHVYFSHRAHVGIGKMTCQECHGDVASWTKPPRKPNLRLQSMSACMACHRQRGASNECGVCHR